MQRCSETSGPRADEAPSQTRNPHVPTSPAGTDCAAITAEQRSAGHEQRLGPRPWIRPLSGRHPQIADAAPRDSASAGPDHRSPGSAAPRDIFSAPSGEMLPATGKCAVSPRSVPPRPPRTHDDSRYFPFAPRDSRKPGAFTGIPPRPAEVTRAGKPEKPGALHRRFRPAATCSRTRPALGTGRPSRPEPGTKKTNAVTGNRTSATLSRPAGRPAGRKCAAPHKPPHRRKKNPIFKFPRVCVTGTPFDDRARHPSRHEGAEATASRRTSLRLDAIDNRRKLPKHAAAR